MRVIIEPKVYFISKPSINWVDLENFLADSGHDPTNWLYGDETSCDDAELLCETGGRVCYDSFTKRRPGGSKAYLDNIKEIGHGSVIEHANYSFIFKDISRECSHELVRHRAGWAFSQRSQRFVDESNTGFVLPEDLRESYLIADGKAQESEQDLLSYRMKTDAFYAWRDSCEHSQITYVQLMKLLEKKFEGREIDKTELRKRMRQTARSVLPACVETTIQVTANVRAWRHAIEMRASRFADPQIRRLFVKVWERLKEESPLLFSDYEKVALEDGTYELSTIWRKV